MKEESKSKTLIFGIGNVGRQDDGLGWIFLDYLQNEHMEAVVDIQYRYQLQIEDAELIRNYDRVIFIDACKSEIKNGFCFKPIEPTEDHGFSTHALVPETIIFLTGNLYDHHPEAFILGIQGFDWNLEMGITDPAYKNYLKAINFFVDHKDEIIDPKKELTALIQTGEPTGPKTTN
ncbi:MAG: hydrogenase maturation protease [Flavobacteriaceae bacterium]|nr:hydrogenase maturation protease [Flavobacteriaceae bacterium]